MKDIKHKYIHNNQSMFLDPFFHKNNQIINHFRATY
jgi:hypothetical protein